MMSVSKAGTTVLAVRRSLAVLRPRHAFDDAICEYYYTTVCCYEKAYPGLGNRSTLYIQGFCG